MSDMSREHDELIAKLAAAEDPWAVLRGERIDDPALLAELEALVRLLDAAGAHEREEVEAACVESEQVPPDLVANTLRSLAAEARPDAASGPREARPTGGDSGSAPRVLAWLAGLAAAAFVVWSVVGLRDTGSGEVMLGSEALGLVRPVGEVERYAPFEWEGRLPTNGYFVVELLSSESSPIPPAHTSSQTELHTWTPSAAVLSELPDSIDWRVQVFDASGQVVDTAFGSARLSRH